VELGWVGALRRGNETRGVAFFTSAGNPVVYGMLSKFDTLRKHVIHHAGKPVNLWFLVLRLTKYGYKNYFLPLAFLGREVQEG